MTTHEAHRAPTCPIRCDVTMVLRETHLLSGQADGPIRTTRAWVCPQCGEVEVIE